MAFTQLRGDVNPSPPADTIVPLSESEAEYSFPYIENKTGTPVTSRRRLLHNIYIKKECVIIGIEKRNICFSNESVFKDKNPSYR